MACAAPGVKGLACQIAAGCNRVKVRKYRSESLSSWNHCLIPPPEMLSGSSKLQSPDPCFALGVWKLAVGDLMSSPSCEWGFAAAQRRMRDSIASAKRRAEKIAQAPPGPPPQKIPPVRLSEIRRRAPWRPLSAIYRTERAR